MQNVRVSVRVKQDLISEGALYTVKRGALAWSRVDPEAQPPLSLGGGGIFLRFSRSEIWTATTGGGLGYNSPVLEPAGPAHF